MLASASRSRSRSPAGEAELGRCGRAGGNGAARRRQRRGLGAARQRLEPMEHQGRDDDRCEAESFHRAWLHPLSLLNGTSRAADPTWRVIGFHRLIAMKMLIAKKRLLARHSYRLAGPELEVVRRGQALPRERLHCQLPFISPDLPCRNWSYLSEDSLTLSRTCSMILLASPSKTLMLPKLARTDIPRQGQRSFRAFRILSGTADGCNRLREFLSTWSEPAGRVPAGNRLGNCDTAVA